MAGTGTERDAKGVEAGAGVGTPLAPPVDVTVRHCETLSDYEACVRLQSATWGPGYRDVVTASLLKVSQRVGGVVAGAFLESGELAGFVFGLTGVNGGGRVIHWSHMLAVDPAYRDLGVGRRLKAFQWEALRSLGASTAYWTFDPLVARNAHLNLNRLGVTLEEYVVDMYADTGSGLHAFGTDRFVVSWPIEGAAARVGRSPVGKPGPVVNVDVRGRPLRTPREEGSECVGIEIPSDIEPMVETDLAALREWRVSTRSAFRAYLGRGYELTGFERGAEVGRYVLEARGRG